MILRVNEQDEQSAEQPAEPVVETPAAAGEDASEVARDEAGREGAEPNPEANEPGDDPAEHDGEAGEEQVSDALEDDSPAAPDMPDEHAPENAEQHVLELVQELEYAKSPATEKKGKKSDEDEEAVELTLTSVSEARAVLEGYLFTSNEPLSVQRLSRLMNNLHPKTVRGLLLELQMDYDNRSGALQIVEIAGGFQMATRPHLADWMFRMHRHTRRSALSPATLETLAIVAYKQPITKGEIEAIRGVESSGTVRTLQDLNMVEASGRREVVGRPQLFVTTEQFLKAFGLKSLADLPSISELRNLFASEQKLQAAVAQAATPASDGTASADNSNALEEPADVSMSSHADEPGDEDEDAGTSGSDGETTSQEDEPDSPDAEMASDEAALKDADDQSEETTGNDAKAEVAHADERGTQAAN
jgi:segregation and condensation protein B